jgi:hypothetical protein
LEASLFQLANGFDDRILLFGWTGIFSGLGINPIGGRAQLPAMKFKNVGDPA